MSVTSLLYENLDNFDDAEKGEGEADEDEEKGESCEEVGAHHRSVPAL